MLLFRSAVGVIYFAAVPPMLLSASGELASFLALFTGLFLFWRWWRAKRIAQWAEDSCSGEECSPSRSRGAPFSVERRQPLRQFRPAARARDVLRRHGGFPRHPAASLGGRDRRRPPRSRRLPVYLLGRRPLRLPCHRAAIRCSRCVVVLTLTVGIGINASIFTVVNGMMITPHVYKDPAVSSALSPNRACRAFPGRSPIRNTCISATRTALSVSSPPSVTSPRSSAMTIPAAIWASPSPATSSASMDSIAPSSAASSMAAIAPRPGRPRRRHLRKGLAPALRFRSPHRRPHHPRQQSRP